MIKFGLKFESKTKRGTRQNLIWLRNPKPFVMRSVWIYLRSSEFNKIIIDETRHQDLSKNINYKVIGIVMSEI